MKIAKTSSEILQCKYLIADVYHRNYKIYFSNDIFDLNAKIEPYPHQFVMGMIGKELVACTGLYTGQTYVEKYGAVTEEDIQAKIKEAGMTERYGKARKRELTKFVVKEGWNQKGIGKFLWSAAHSRDFINIGTNDENTILLCCANQYIYKHFYESVGIKTRFLKEFPFYRVHEFYRSPENPMDSRLILPEIDIPEKAYNMELPGEYEIGKD